MPDWSGSFDEQGTPVLPICVSIPHSPSTDLTAIIDTGFTGFLCLPLAAITLFRSQIEGYQPVRFADGSNSVLLEVRATIVINSEHVTGIAVIEPDGKEVLIGMEFLKAARRGLIVLPSKAVVMLPAD